MIYFLDNLSHAKYLTCILHQQQKIHHDTHKQYRNEEMEDKWPNYINQRAQEDIYDTNLTKYFRQTDDLTLTFIPKSKNLNTPLIWL